MVELPLLANIESDELFGLVVSNYTVSFKGLLEIKAEEDDDNSLLDSIPLEGNTGGNNLISTNESINIDPQLLVSPHDASGSRSIPSAPTTTIANEAIASISKSSKRKLTGDTLSDTSAPNAGASKKARTRSESVSVVLVVS